MTKKVEWKPTDADHLLYELYIDDKPALVRFSTQTYRALIREFPNIDIKGFVVDSMEDILVKDHELSLTKEEVHQLAEQFRDIATKEDCKK